MSRKLSLWFLAVAAVGVVVVLGGRRERPREAPEAEGGASVAVGAPVAPVSPAGGGGPAAAEEQEVAPLGEEAGLAALPPEDVEWVLDAVARTEAARVLSEREREALIAQLSSVRMHAVLERTEPMAVAPEVLP